MKTFQDIINELAPEVEEWRKEHAIRIQKELERIRTGIVEEDGERKVIEIVVKKCDELNEKLYIPEQCKDCEVSKDEDLRSRIIGLNLVTPYSYLLIEGCNLDRVCDKKNFQLLYFGLGVDTLMVDSFWNDYWRILTGEVVIKDMDEFVKEAKKKVGFIETKNDKLEKPLILAIPKIVNDVVECIIKEKLTCTFEYPLTNFKSKFSVRKKDGSVEYKFAPIEEEFETTTKVFFRLRWGYYVPEIGIMHSNVIYFGDGEVQSLGDRFFSNVRNKLLSCVRREDDNPLEEIQFAMMLDSYMNLLEKKGSHSVIRTLKEIEKDLRELIVLVSKCNQEK